MRYWDGSAWTQNTQGGAPRKGRFGLLIGGGLLVLAALTAGTIAVVAHANNGAANAIAPSPSVTPAPTAAATPMPSQQPTPAATSSGDLGKIAVPKDWVKTQSNRGAFTYKHSPDWTNATAIVGDIESSFDVPGATSEAGGAWFAGGSLVDGGTIVFPIAISDGTQVLSLRLELAGLESALKEQSDSVEKVASDSFTTPQGYDGMREIYHANSQGQELYSATYVLKHGKTLMVVSVTSTSPPSDFETEAMALVNSIVIKHEPTSAS
jgi:hypothetical protein